MGYVDYPDQAASTAISYSILFPKKRDGEPEEPRAANGISDR